MHRTNERRRIFRSLLEDALDLEFLPADPVRLIPMDLGMTHPTIRQPHPSDPLALAPLPFTIGSHETMEFTDPSARGDRPRVADRANDLNLHAGMIGDRLRALNVQRSWRLRGGTPNASVPVPPLFNATSASSVP